MPTIAQAIDQGAALLKASGIDSERRTAGVLLAFVLRADRTHLLTKSETQVGESDFQTYLSFIERRARGEPLQYITGHQEFYGLDFVVTPDVLIPRPETEFLVERIIKLAEASPQESPLIVDAGAGSGCIAVAAAVHLPRARVIATDASQAALDIARVNAERNGVSDRIEFEAGDLLSPLAARGLEGAVDILASNPPYVDEGKPEQIQREVREWEPGAALYGGSDGLLFYRRLLADGFRFVRPAGHLVCEIGYGQLEAITEMIASSPWEMVDVISDLQGIPRTLTIRRPTWTG